MAMPVQFIETEIPDVLMVDTKVAEDERGFFTEIYAENSWRAAGFDERFVQDNLSQSAEGTLRGMHYQLAAHGMSKLVRVLSGSIYDVAVDLRRGSPTFGKWVGRKLSASNRLALWVPVGFAHGFLALEDETLVLYKCTNLYAPEAERSLHYADSGIGIVWPMTPTLVSPKDAAAPKLHDAEFDFVY